MCYIVELELRAYAKDYFQVVPPYRVWDNFDTVRNYIPVRLHYYFALVISIRFCCTRIFRSSLMDQMLEMKREPLAYFCILVMI